MSRTAGTFSNGFPIIDSKTSLDDILLAASRMDTTPPQAPSASSPAAAHPAIARCNQAYSGALELASAGGRPRWDGRDGAKRAFREAMPPLIGRENIREFIACVAHAMLIQVMEPAEGARLLYAAQVAYSAQDPRPHRANPKSESKRLQKRPLGAPETALK